MLRRSRPSAERPSLEAGELARGQRPFASRVENVLERYGVDDVETIFRALVANRAVHVPGYSSDEMVDRLQRAWDVEPGYSKTAICLLVASRASTLGGRAAEPPTAGLPAERGHARGTHRGVALVDDE